MNEMKLYIHYEKEKVEFKATSEDNYYNEIQSIMKDGWRQVIVSDEITREIIIHYFLNKKWNIDEILVQRYNEVNIPHITSSLTNAIAKCKEDRGYLAIIMEELEDLYENEFTPHRLVLSKNSETIEISPNGICKFTDNSPDDILQIVHNYLLREEE